MTNSLISRSLRHIFWKFRGQLELPPVFWALPFGTPPGFLDVTGTLGTLDKLVFIEIES